jgi:adenosylmethionine-8-amino-7-oxononanoate aminotransferase
VTLLAKNFSCRQFAIAIAPTDLCPLVLSPPLIIAESEIEMVFATIRRILDTLD